MAEHDINLVTSKASSVVAQNLKLSLATPAGAITPATITAMAGMAKGGALQVAPAVTSAIAKIQAVAADAFSSGGGNAAILSAANVSLTSVAPNASAISSTISSLTTAAAGLGVTLSGSTTSSMTTAMTAATNLNSLTQKMIPPGNPAAFGQLLMQAQNHISDAIDLKSATNFISNSSFGDYGDGVTNMKSMVTRGLDTKFGDLTSAAAAMSSAGPAFDMGDMKNFGSAAGLTSKLSDLKLGNASGAMSLLAKNGVDLDNMSDGVYTETIEKSLGTITDPGMLTKITDQMGLGSSASQNITKLTDLTDVKKLVSPDILNGKSPDISSINVKGIVSNANFDTVTSQATSLGLTTDLKGIGSKFSDMGAKFANPAAAANMLKSIKVPEIPNLNSTKSLTELMAGHAPDLNNLTGTGAGPLGVPNMTDFMQAVSGGPAISNILANGATPSAIASIESMVTSSKSMISKMGVDIDNDPPTPMSLGSVMSFATNLHKIGADTSGSGIANILERMSTNDQYGDAIKAAMAEGKNNAVMAANNINPPKYAPPVNTELENNAKRIQLEAEYDDFASLVYNNESLGLKKHYAEKLINDIIPPMIDYYTATNNTIWLPLAQKRLPQWQNYLAALEADIAQGG